MIIPLRTYNLKTKCVGDIVELILHDGVETIAMTAISKSDWYACADEDNNSEHLNNG